MVYSRAESGNLFFVLRLHDFQLYVLELFPLVVLVLYGK